MLVAIVLAAGQGSRFRVEAGADQDKLLANCVGRDGVMRPVIEQVLVNLPDSLVARWLVTSPDRTEVIRLAEAHGCQVLLLQSPAWVKASPQPSRPVPRRMAGWWSWEICRLSNHRALNG